MSAILTYLAGKLVEYSSTFDWVQQQLGASQAFQTAHPLIARELSERILEARRRLTVLDRVVRLGSRALGPRGLSLVNELQLDVWVLSENYLACYTK